MGNRLGSAVLALGVAAAVVVLCATHAGDVGAALVAVSPWVFAAAAALHVATLALRSEAWRLSLASAGGDALSREAVHGANAAAFLAGALQSQAGLPVRVAVLRRIAPERAPPPGRICVADVPIFTLELCATVLLLALGAVAGHASGWILPVAATGVVAVLVVARVAPDRLSLRPSARGLAVLGDRRRRGPLVLLVAGFVALTVARLWLLLTVCGLPHGLAEVTWTFAALGVFGLLPLGPGAPASATLAAAGGVQVGAALAAGPALAATSVAAVVLYAIAVGAVARLRSGRHERRPARRRPRRQPRVVFPPRGTPAP